MPTLSVCALSPSPRQWSSLPDCLLRHKMVHTHFSSLFHRSVLSLCILFSRFFISVPLLSFRKNKSLRVSLCHLKSFWPLHPRGVAAMMAAVHRGSHIGVNLIDNRGTRVLTGGGKAIDELHVDKKARRKLQRSQWMV